MEEQWVIGNTFDVDAWGAYEQFFTDTNAVVRSLDRRTNKVWRQWDRCSGKLFLGLVFNVLPDEELPDGYELCHLPKRKVIRLSGTNWIDENSKMEAVKAFAKDNGFKLELELELEYWRRLSGQSFSLYQCDIERSTKVAPPHLFSVWGL